MTLQFRKRVKIVPGVTLNFGKKGMSVSAGIKGARVTLGKGRVTRSVGLPGTGIYDRTTTRVGNASGAGKPSGISAAAVVVMLALGLTAFYFLH